MTVKKTTTKKTRMVKLEPVEKEVIINFSKASEMASVYSSDPAEIAKFKRKGLKMLWGDRFGAEFEINKKYITVRKPTRKRRTTKAAEPNKGTVGESVSG